MIAEFASIIFSGVLFFSSLPPSPIWLSLSLSFKMTCFSICAQIGFQITEICSISLMHFISIRTPDQITAGRLDLLGPDWTKLARWFTCSG